MRTSLHSQRCGCVRLVGEGGGRGGGREKMSWGEERGTSGSDVPGTRTIAQKRKENERERDRDRREEGSVGDTGGDQTETR